MDAASALLPLAIVQVGLLLMEILECLKRRVAGFGSNEGGALGLGEDVRQQLTPLQYPDLRASCV